jgi:hypothetical protein
VLHLSGHLPTFCQSVYMLATRPRLTLVLLHQQPLPLSVLVVDRSMTVAEVSRRWCVLSRNRFICLAVTVRREMFSELELYMLVSRRPRHTPYFPLYCSTSPATAVPLSVSTPSLTAVAEKYICRWGVFVARHVCLSSVEDICHILKALPYDHFNIPDHGFPTIVSMLLSEYYIEQFKVSIWAH